MNISDNRLKELVQAALKKTNSNQESLRDDIVRRANKIYENRWTLDTSKLARVDSNIFTIWNMGRVDNHSLEDLISMMGFSTKDIDPGKIIPLGSLFPRTKH